MTAPLNKVLNIDTCSIVLLPLSHKKVLEQGGIFHHLSTNIPAINGEDYEKLAAALGLDPVVSGLTRSYFVDRCVAFIGDDKPVVSQKGYGVVFDLLHDAGFNIKQMLERLDFIIYSWREESEEDVITRTYSVQDPTRRLSAVEIIESENVTDAFVTNYQGDRDLMVLYGDSGIKLTA